MSNTTLLSIGRRGPARPSSSASTLMQTKPLNWVPAAILRSPLHRILSSKMLLIEFVGRRSGRRYATPVNYHQDGRTVLISTDSPWSRNFAPDGGNAVIHLRGQRLQVRVALVPDPAEAAAGLLTIVRAQPAYGRWTNISIGPDGEPDRDAAQAEIARGRVLLRLHVLGQERR